MTLNIFDTRQQQKVPFEPIEPGKVSAYVCGVTVYDYCHVGHARCYVVFDAIVRYLRHKGLDVTYVRNFTDVDDKIIKRAGELSVPISELTERFISAFCDDMEALDVLRADIEPRVTDHIDDIISMVEGLIEQGHGYVSNGDVYFAVDTFEAYADLSKRNLEDLRAGASERTDAAELAKKRNPLDFALWKSSKEGEPAWDSPWGPGRPGWHIECSAMSTRYLGADFDIHGGGQDLIFPHHENEIAQAVGATGAGFAHHWLHNGFVNINQEKMSKSLGNFFTIRDVLQVFHPQVLRFFLLSTHYRGPINYCDANLVEATRRVDHIYGTLARIDEYLELKKDKHKKGDVLEPKMASGLLTELESALDDDFCTPRAIAALSEPIRRANELLAGKEIAGRYATLKELREAISVVASVLGVFHHDPTAFCAKLQKRLVAQRGINPSEIECQIEARATARKERDFEKADAIRAELNERGVQLMDTPTGTCWRVVP